MHLVGFTVEKYHDAWSHESQICTIYIWSLVYTVVYKMCLSVTKSCGIVSQVIKKVPSPPSRMLSLSIHVTVEVTALLGSWCHLVKMLNFDISNITEGVE